MRDSLEGTAQERDRTQQRLQHSLLGRRRREMQTLLWFPQDMDLNCLPGFLQLPGAQVLKWVWLCLLELSA